MSLSADMKPTRTSLLDDNLDLLPSLDLIRIKMKSYIWKSFDMENNPYSDVYEQYSIRIYDTWALETAFWNEGTLDDVGFYLDTCHQDRYFAVYLRVIQGYISYLEKTEDDKAITLKTILEQY